MSSSILRSQFIGDMILSIGEFFLIDLNSLLCLLTGRPVSDKPTSFNDPKIKGISHHISILLFVLWKPHSPKLMRSLSLGKMSLLKWAPSPSLIMYLAFVSLGKCLLSWDRLGLERLHFFLCWHLRKTNLSLWKVLFWPTIHPLQPSSFTLLGFTFSKMTFFTQL